jgi:hypothetical protein
MPERDWTSGLEAALDADQAEDEARDAAQDARIAELEDLVDALLEGTPPDEEEPPPPPPVVSAVYPGRADAWPYRPLAADVPLLPPGAPAEVDVKRDSTASVNYGTWDARRYQATTADPIRSLTDTRNNRGTIYARIPDDAVPSPGSNGLGGDRQMAVIQPDGSIVEGWLMVRQADGNWHCGDIGRWPADTDWVGKGVTDGPWPECNGMQAANVSIDVGAYRPEHFADGVIRSVITLILGFGQLGKTALPGFTTDTGAAADNTGRIPYGQRFVARGSFNPASFTGDDRVVAQQLVDYGLMATDRTGSKGGSSFVTRMDPRCTPAQRDAAARVLTAAIPHLRAVDPAAVVPPPDEEPPPPPDEEEPPPPPPPVEGWTVHTGSALVVPAGATVEGVVVRGVRPGETDAVQLGNGSTLRRFVVEDVGGAVQVSQSATVEDGIIRGWSTDAEQEHALYIRQGVVRRVIIEEPAAVEDDPDSFDLHGFGTAVGIGPLLIEDVWSRSNNRALFGAEVIPINGLTIRRLTKRLSTLKIGYDRRDQQHGAISLIDVETPEIDLWGIFAGGGVISGRVGMVQVNASGPLTYAELAVALPNHDLSGLQIMGRSEFTAWAATAPDPAFAAPLRQLLSTAP